MKNFNDTNIDTLGVPQMTELSDLVRNLRLSDDLVYWLCSDANERYKTYYVQKRSGGKREISAPVKSLKVVQRWILDNILSKINVSPYSYGFVKTNQGSPLVSCAERHRKNLYIMKIDIKDFYPSIKRERVFFAFKDIGYNTIISNLLANVCTHNGSLPQGAVTSAYLANLLCSKMDYRIAGLCNKRNIDYTRYADDLVFSSDNRASLKSIYSAVKAILQSEGFAINERKTQFLSPGTRKRVLGITVNDSLIKAPKEMKRMLRAMIHKAIVNGDYTDYYVIKGYVSYISSVESDYIESMKNYILSLYRYSSELGEDKIRAYNNNKFFSDLPDM